MASVYSYFKGSTRFRRSLLFFSSIKKKTKGDSASEVIFIHLSWLNMDILDTPNTKHFMTGPEGNNFVSLESAKGNKINCFPRDQSWSVYSWKFIKPRCDRGRRLTIAGNSALLPSDDIDFATLPAQRFWRETVSLLDVRWPQSNQWECALFGKKFQLYNHIPHNNDWLTS